MILRILAVGKLREAYYQAGVEDYLGRIRHYFPIEQIEVPVGTGEESNGGGRGAMVREAAALRRHVTAGSRVVALERTGRPFSTEEFAKWLEECMNTAISRVDFVIGGAWGLDAGFVRDADVRLSLSAMTLPHELARLVLAEQIYRALSLWKGHPYHK
ncbi:MAG: 23S rRNA (pseudouridine(1915)-N(3))-methyltransferase RlmH [bacterium]|nr:23S rRNA (pseudouridine(1915)-N(3))-methyltransferase RlmH [bacterium]